MTYNCAVCGYPGQGDRLAERTFERDTAIARAERAEVALTKISAIRDSIIGMQGFNFSEHAYPLVAALKEAGYSGTEYEIARQNLGTLITQRDAAIARAEKAEAQLAKVTREQDELAAAINRFKEADAEFTKILDERQRALDVVRGK